MVLPYERESTNLGPWQSAATLASAIVVLGIAVSLPIDRAQTPGDRQPLAESCTVGDDVSNFVCRNRWVADLAHNHR